MIGDAALQVVTNRAWGGAAPRLSVLIPFFRWDPRMLLVALDREASESDAPVEIVTLDDGSGDDALGTAVADAVRSMAIPAQFVRLSVNEGRAKGRNRLADRARGRHLLFVDADMLPDAPSFLTNYLRLIDAEDPPVTVGGKSVSQTPRRREHALNRYWSEHKECLPAAARRAAPEKFVFTSNLLIRRDVFAVVKFDERYCGWGWEDIEWGARVAQDWPILHIDNTASDLGLVAPNVLIDKGRESVANFGRFAAAHRSIAAAYPSYRAARLLRHVPLRGLWRPLLSALALAPFVPLSARCLALRAYCAALRADVI